MRWACVLLTLLAASCHNPPAANPHYVLGAPYPAGGVWYYPRESYEGQETGIATIYPPDHPELTADGEIFDQTSMAAAHQTLQLPAVARLTNLENGRQILIRINDRGPATPHRLIEVTRRVATLLGFVSEGRARVRFEVLPRESHAAVDAVPGAPALQVAAAPRGEVQQADLPPPGSTAQASTPAAGLARTGSESVTPNVPLRLPETVSQTAPSPGNLYVRLGTFQNFQYADMQRAQVAALGASVVSAFTGRAQSFHVIIGPLTNIEQADTVLDRVIHAGVTDARIVVE